MKDREPVGHIFDLHVVRYDVTLDSRRKFFAHLRIGVEQERIGLRGNENDRVQLAFRAQDRGLNRGLSGCFPQIVGDLTVEKTKRVRSGNTQLYPR